ncbi:MAG: DNA cytosine methyltransferase [Chthoniobacterales bacterium]
MPAFSASPPIDLDEHAITTFRKNFPKETLVLRKDLTKFPPDRLAAKLGVNHVDVIVGGPPCQGFSTVRQVGAANHGPRVRKDKRRWLFRPFLAYVAAFRPRFFVMENVMGIQSAAKGKFFTMVQSEARKLGYLVNAQVEEAWKLGVPQTRRRQLIIGVRDDIAGFFPSELEPATRAGTPHEGRPSLWDAIGDLPPLSAGTGTEECEYDLPVRVNHLRERGAPCRHYLENIVEIDAAKCLTAIVRDHIAIATCETLGDLTKERTAAERKRAA